VPARAQTAPQAAAPAPTTPTTPAAADPGEGYYLFLEGHLLESTGDVDGAIAAFKKAADADPTASAIHAELSGVYARAGRATEAVTEALAALKLNADDHEAQRVLGLVQASMADDTSDETRHANLTTEAISHLSQALSAGSRDLAAELALGRLYVEGGQYDKGAAVLRTFLTDRPDYPEAVMLLADRRTRYEIVPILR